jgi:fermentation-respiration switch protein FrsA (DUF1100 family)
LRAQGVMDDAIIGYGESLGGAVIAELASKRELKAIILDSTFASIHHMARTVSPFIPSWLLASRFDSEAKVRTIRVPKLIIHSINDEIVPYAQGQKLFAAAADPKVFLKIHGAHNSNFFESGKILTQAVGAFVGQLD